MTQIPDYTSALVRLGGGQWTTGIVLADRPEGVRVAIAGTPTTVARADVVTALDHLEAMAEVKRHREQAALAADLARRMRDDAPDYIARIDELRAEVDRLRAELAAVRAPREYRCVVPGCRRRHNAGDMCLLHYSRRQSRGFSNTDTSPEVIEAVGSGWTPRRRGRKGGA